MWDNVENITNYKGYINHIPITKGAFPDTTEIVLNKYLTYTSSLTNGIHSILNFAAFTVLEDISYTRKDGQCLRWDYRSKRELRQKFDKGKIIGFKTAIDLKLNEIIADLSPRFEDTFFPPEKIYSKGKISIIEGSCLYKLPEMAENTFDFIITSPPYANRYDYTRTYALELIFLGKNNVQVKDLRQQMLSCTVENKSKVDELQNFYESIGRIHDFKRINEHI